jgi:uncharacterized protein GlcG (DUF336 family)
MILSQNRTPLLRIMLYNAGHKREGIMKRTFILAACAALASVSTQAQDKKDLPFAPALEAAQTALATCAGQGHLVAVAIVDSNDATKVLLRDQAPARSIDSARRKAYTVLKTGMSSLDFAKSLGSNAPKAPPATPDNAHPRLPGVNGDNDLMAAGGGLPIKMGGTIIGAIAVGGSHGEKGISGGVFDEACAKAGLDKLAGRL